MRRGRVTIMARRKGGNDGEKKRGKKKQVGGTKIQRLTMSQSHWMGSSRSRVDGALSTIAKRSL